MEYIQIAKLNKTFGLKGEFRAYSLTDFPEERFKKGKTMFFLDPKTSETTPFTLSSYRKKDPFVFIGFKEIQTIEEAEKHLGKFLVIPKEEAVIPNGAFHVFDLLDCEVYSEEGEKIGVVIDIFSYSPVKNLRIKREGKNDLQVPFVDQFIKQVDVEAKRIVIHVIEGLL